MTPAKRLHRSPRLSGFTLLEMIAVLAIMAIIAAGLAPNTLRLIERAAVRAEAETVHALADQTKRYFHDTGTVLTAASWNQELVRLHYVEYPSIDVLYNKRQRRPDSPLDRSALEPDYAKLHGYITRLYVPDTANQRAIIVSSMRPDVPLPSVNEISTYFDNIWNTPDGTVPGRSTGLPAVGWGSWNNDNIDYLVIERVNFRSVYSADRTAEVETLHMLAEQAKLCLRDTETTLTTANWTTLLSPYVSLSGTDLLYNRHQLKTGTNTRLYVQDPNTTNQRGLFISSIAPGVALPTATNVAAYFNNIWNTPDGMVPGTYPGLPANGWGAWNALNISQLVIQRVDYTPVYATDLRDLPIKLTGSPGGYRLVRPNMTYMQDATPANINAHPNFRLELYRETGCINLVTSYPIIKLGAEFDFNGTTWTMKQP